MAIDDLNDLLDLDLPHEDFDTVGGFVFGQFGRQPEAGESVCYENLEFIVEKTDGRRVDQITLKVSASGTQENQDSSEGVNSSR